MRAREILKLGFYLCVVCSVAALGLSATNHLTAGRIKEQKALAEKRALTEVLPTATSFRQKKGYREGLGRGGEVVGYVLNASENGYSGKIEAIVGINREMQVTGIKILSQTETPGLGTKITEKAFLQQFIGKTADKIALKRDGGTIDVITAATISSRAVTKATKEAISSFERSRREEAKTE